MANAIAQMVLPIIMLFFGLMFLERFFYVFEAIVRVIRSVTSD